MTTRTELTREATARESSSLIDEERLLWLDENLIPAGFVYKWTREAVLNQPDPNNIRLAMRQGWTFVPIDRHPELRAPLMPGQATPDELIRVGGLILMERPKRLDDQEKHRRVEENRQILRDIDRNRQTVGSQEHFRASDPDVKVRHQRAKPTKGRQIDD